MKARIKSNRKIVEVISRFMPRKRNAASRDWVCNLSDGTCIDESQLEYIEESIDGLDEAADEYAEKHGFRVPYDGSDNFYDDVDVKASKEAFIAGAKWQAEQLLKSSPLPEDTVLFNKGVAEGRRLAEEEQADLFTIVALDAAQRAREQMMKVAVEGEVESFSDMHPEISIPLNPTMFKVGDKVRVIICKKED